MGTAVHIKYVSVGITFLIFFKNLFEHPYGTSIPTTLVCTLNGAELYQTNQYLKIK